MITITDNGGGSFTFVKNGITSIIQKALVTSIREVVDSVFIICKGGKTYKVDNYTEVSGQASAEALVEFIEGIVNGVCPTIALADLASSIAYKSVAYSDSSAASGGTGPYTYAVTSGSLPGGLSLNANTGAITGTPTTFGESDTFTITATDSEGCTGFKEYTIVVWAMFENTTPVDSADTMIVVTSGLPAAIGTGISIQSVEFSATFDDNSVAGLFLDDPLAANSLLFYEEGDLSGSNFTNTVFDRDAVNNIVAGTAPYTGSFRANNEEPAGFDHFNGSDTNGNWMLYLTYNVAPPVGTINSCRIIFKPI